MQYETLWTFETANFTVDLACAPEDCPDVSWADEETLDKLARGIYQNVTFRVRVLLRGDEISADYLGNSVYEDVREFRDHIGLAAKSRADGRNYGSYFPDMVRSAIAEARRKLLNIPHIRAA